MRCAPSPLTGQLNQPVGAFPTTTDELDRGSSDEPRRSRMKSGGGESWHEDWRADAACVGENLDVFFPLGDQATHHALSNQAKEICSRCPVMDTCRAWALRTSPEFGIFGGLTAHERRLVREGRWNGYGPRRTARTDAA
ncbi:WhiB family transcriptional regulator [Microlunatus flavus]|uniref:WhiB family transcriptional regulator n=1 Tax=Microlunatus flavus TaxID=1036181 RepID=UPI000B890C5F|nr:WhiB family transcriptional regulator [Microlunatus flavus]